MIIALLCMTCVRFCRERRKTYCSIILNFISSFVIYVSAYHSNYVIWLIDCSRNNQRHWYHSHETQRVKTSAMRTYSLITLHYIIPYYTVFKGVTTRLSRVPDALSVAITQIHTLIRGYVRTLLYLLFDNFLLLFNNMSYIAKMAMLLKIIFNYDV